MTKLYTLTPPPNQENQQNLITNLIHIGEDAYILDEEGQEGEIIFLEEEEMPEEVATTEGQTIPDPRAREWEASTIPIRDSRNYSPDPPGTIRLCKNELCHCAPEEGPSLVPCDGDNNYRGPKKLYCCVKCRHRAEMRSYMQRKRGGGTHLECNTHTGEQVVFQRTKPSNSALADQRYKTHIMRTKQGYRPTCPNATLETNLRCPAHFLGDYQSEQKRCLIYAVIVDDMKEQWAKDRQEYYIRQYTTNDGRWTDIEDFLPHMDDRQKLAPYELMGGVEKYPGKF